MKTFQLEVEAWVNQCFGPNMNRGTLQLPKLHGYEVKPGIVLIGEPTPVPGSSKLRCLANAFGALVVVELSIKFLKETDDPLRPLP